MAQLGVEHRKFEADYGQLPKLEDTNPDHDILFTWNGESGPPRVCAFPVSCGRRTVQRG